MDQYFRKKKKKEIVFWKHNSTPDRQGFRAWGGKMQVLHWEPGAASAAGMEWELWLYFQDVLLSLSWFASQYK